MPQGRVTDFDVAGGWGEVRDEQSGSSYPFHCTAIADGSRLIDVGTDVVFGLAPGRMGRWEARELE
jgi:hypothetical protein